MKKYLIVLVVFVNLFAGGLALLSSQKASAASGGCYFGAGTCSAGNSLNPDGYYGTNDIFTGRSTSGNGIALKNKVTGNPVTSKPEFINFINDRLSQGAHDRTGAQFVICVMLPGCNGSRPSASDVNTWTALMKQDSVHFSIDHNVAVTTTSWYDPGQNNTFFDQYSSPPRIRDVVYIRQDGVGVIAELEIACGNMTGNNGKLKSATIAAHAQMDNITNGKSYNNGDNPSVAPGTKVRFYNWVSTKNTVNTGNGAFTYNVVSSGSKNLPGAGNTVNSGSAENLNQTYQLNPDQDRPTNQNAFTVTLNTPGTYCRKTNITDKGPAYVVKNNDPAEVCVTVVATSTPVLNCNIKFSPANPSVGDSITVTVNANAGGYNGNPPAKVQLGLTQPISTSKNVGPKSSDPADQNNYTASFTVTYASAGNPTVKGYVKDLTSGSTVSGNCSTTIPVGGTPPSVKCNITVNPGLFVDPYMPVTITLSANTLGSFPSGDTISYALSMSGAVSGSQVSASSSMSRTNTFSFGSHSVSGTVTATDTTAVPQLSASTNCSTSFDVGYMPYLSVYGGDAMAGISPQQNSGVISKCVPNSQAGFESWNKDTAGDYSGAGSQIAIAALGDKSYHFVSNLGGADPTRITLANDNSDIPNANYGGSFGTSGAYGLPTDCDFIGSAPTTSPSSNPAWSNDGSGNWTNSGENLGTDGHAEVYVITSGNVFIRNNIVYGAYGAIGQIPSFKLVVIGGNIYIGAGVSTLHGLYVAEPDSSGNGGTIYTCAAGMNNPYEFSAANYYPNDYNACNNQLNIYGSFVAKHIDFLRSNGTLGTANMSDDYTSTTPAEKFIYSPEMWLPNGTDGGSFQPDSFQGLPPVL